MRIENNDYIKGKRMISIIIPHKNSIELLQRCIDSIPTKESLEVIVVDDNSGIDQENWIDFSERNRNVSLYLTKEGKGAGYARNVGLNHAKGEWVMFSDADDYFYPGAFDVIDNYVSCHKDVDVVYFICNSRDGTTNEILPDRVPRIRKAIQSKDVNLLRYKSYVPWGKIIRRSLIDTNCIQFEEIEVSNDLMFSTLIGYYSKSVGLIEDCLYCCTRNEGSLFYKMTPERRQIRLNAALRVNSFLHEKGLKQFYLDTTLNTFSFLPYRPLLFLKYLFACWYRDNTLLYLKNVARRIYLMLFSK